MPYVKCNDLDLYYEEFGRGEALLFLHSHFSRGLLAFSAQILPFSGSFRCLFPDFRGHGRTRCDSLAWDSRRIADDMADFLDALGIASAHLFGYSCGAYVGCYMAAKYPGKVKSLVTVGGGAYPRAEDADSFLPEHLLEKKRCRIYRGHEGKAQRCAQGGLADLSENNGRRLENAPEPDRCGMGSYLLSDIFYQRRA